MLVTEIRSVNILSTHFTTELHPQTLNFLMYYFKNEWVDIKQLLTLSLSCGLKSVPILEVQHIWASYYSTLGLEHLINLSLTPQTSPRDIKNACSSCSGTCVYFLNCSLLFIIDFKWNLAFYPQTICSS